MKEIPQIQANADHMWPLAAGVVTLLVTAGGRKASEKAWEKGTGQPIPRDSRTPLRHALLWALASGLAVSLLRVFTARGLDRLGRQVSDRQD